MSDSEIQLLRVEVAGLREELESVQSELVRLRRTIAALRIGESGTSSPAVHHSVGEPSESGYSSVTSLAAPPSAGGISRASEATADTIAQLQRNRPAVLSWAQREALCERIGSFLRRSLEGDHRGSSGRDLNPLASRYWLVARGIDNTLYDPPRVFRTWGSAKGLVKRGSEVGNSVFVGLPSEHEVTLVVQAAELRLPAAYEQ